MLCEKEKKCTTNENKQQDGEVNNNQTVIKNF